MLERKLRRFQTKNYVLYAIVIASAAIALLSVARVENITRENRGLIDRVEMIAEENRGLLRQQGAGNLARCAATSAVIQAGRQAILGGLRRGERGYRPRRRAADKYSGFISTEVADVTGRRLIVNRDGSLNCPALAPGAPQVPKATREIPKP